MNAAAANPFSNWIALRPMVKAALMMVPRATHRRRPAAPSAKRSSGPVAGLSPSGVNARFVAASVVDIRTRDRRCQARPRTQQPARSIIACVTDRGIRVALLSPAFWPEVRRGGERIVAELAHGLVEQGHQ